MANTALNRSNVALLTNKSGGALVYGDVVVLDNTNDDGFTTTTTAGLSTRGLGVILEPNGIADNASGLVVTGGYCPKINLNTAATRGQFIKTHTVAGQGTPHSSPQVEGDFAVALRASATPSAILFGSANGPYVTLPVDLTTGVTGDLPFANLTQIAGLSVLGVTGGSTADVAAITAGTTGHVLTRVSSSSLAFAMPAMVLIETQTPTGTGTVTFSSLGSFTHLKLVWQARGTQAATSTTFDGRFNGDTGANYDRQKMSAAATTQSDTESLAQTVINQIGICAAANATAGMCGSGEILIPNYRGTTFWKSGTSLFTFQNATSSGGTFSQANVFNWRSTAPITSIALILQSGNWDTGSTFSLYGIS